MRAYWWRVVIAVAWLAGAYVVVASDVGDRFKSAVIFAFAGLAMGLYVVGRRSSSYKPHDRRRNGMRA